jgi:hypothetical protein
MPPVVHRDTLPSKHRRPLNLTDPYFSPLAALLPPGARLSADGCSVFLDKPTPTADDLARVRLFLHATHRGLALTRHVDVVDLPHSDRRL